VLPQPDGCWFNFDLRTDNQAIITWLKTNLCLNIMYVRLLDEIEDFLFNVTHLPGSRNPSPADPGPLRLRRWAGAGSLDWPLSPMQIKQGQYSRLGRVVLCSTVLAVIRAG
jgi:hypothetical protein